MQALNIPQLLPDKRTLWNSSLFVIWLWPLMVRKPARRYGVYLAPKNELLYNSCCICLKPTNSQEIVSYSLKACCRAVSFALNLNHLARLLVVKLQNCQASELTKHRFGKVELQTSPPAHCRRKCQVLSIPPLHNSFSHTSHSRCRLPWWL